MTRFPGDGPSITERWLTDDDVALAKYLAERFAGDEPEIVVDDFDPCTSLGWVALLIALVFWLGALLIGIALWQLWVHWVGAAELALLLAFPAAVIYAARLTRKGK